MSEAKSVYTICRVCNSMSAGNNKNCPICKVPIGKHCKIIDDKFILDKISIDDYFTIADISTDTNFFQAMIQLKEKDIIEYELKMSQFRNQAKQTEQIQEQSQSFENQIECPYCKSTNTQKISGLSKAVSVGLFGIFALGKTTKQWHCNNCNSDF